MMHHQHLFSNFFAVVITLLLLSSSLPQEVFAADTCCPSGYQGTDCTTAASSTCIDNAIEPGIYSTAATTSLSSVTYEGDSLSITATSPIVDGRGCTSLSLGSASTPGTDPVCTTFIKSLKNDDCSDVWATSVSWRDVYGLCGFVLDPETSNPATKSYVGYLTVIHNDSIREVDSWRTQKSVFPIHVKFPSLLNVSNVNIAITSPIAITVFLNDQNYAPATQEAMLSFITRVPFPYTLSGGSITVPATHTRLTFVETTSSTPCSGTSVCQQQWQVVMSPNTGTCSLTGEYDISVIPACREGVAHTPSCPYPDGLQDSTTSHIVANLVSDNFCPVTEVSIIVTPSLAAVSVAGGSLQKINYLMDYPVYFMFQVDSPQAAIQELSLQQVTVSGVGAQSSTPLSLVTNLGPTDLGTQVSFQQKNVAVGSTSQLPFQFTLDSSIFKEGSMQVQAAVMVTYTANSVKRSVMYTLALLMTSDITFSIQHPNTAESVVQLKDSSAAASSLTLNRGGAYYGAVALAAVAACIILM